MMPAESVPVTDNLEVTTTTPAEPAPAEPAPVPDVAPSASTNETPVPAEPAAAAPAVPVVQSASNASPVLAPSAHAAAAHAHVTMSRIIKMAELAKAEIERFVPPEVISIAETDALALLREALL
jgi:hypothetical protein